MTERRQRTRGPMLCKPRNHDANASRQCQADVASQLWRHSCGVTAVAVHGNAWTTRKDDLETVSLETVCVQEHRVSLMSGLVIGPHAASDGPTGGWSGDVVRNHVGSSVHNGPV